MVEIIPPAGQLCLSVTRPPRVENLTALARRKRKQRLREALGLTALEIETDYPDLTEALLFTELLTAAEALDVTKVEAKVASIVEEWVARWLAEKAKVTP